MNGKADNIKLPPILYKYMSLERFLGSLGDYLMGKLWFGSVRSMNDPLEGLPDDLFTDEDEKVGDLFKKALDDCKICSLTTSPDSPVMWAHYAAAHTGVCLGFRVAPAMFEKIAIEYTEIKYTDGFPVRDGYMPRIKSIATVAVTEITQLMMWNLIKETVSYKSIGWAYEKEWRLMRRFGEEKLLKVGELTDIIFGWKCKPSVSEQTILACNNIEQLKDQMLIGFNKNGQHTLMRESMILPRADFDPINAGAMKIPQAAMTFPHIAGSVDSIATEAGMRIYDNKLFASRPTSAVAFFNRGNAYYRRGYLDKAFADYTKALELKPNSAGTYFNLGLVYYNQGELDNAIANYDKALEITPNSAEIYNNRGAAYYHKGDINRAVIDYNTALELKPDMADVYNDRGNAYADQGDTDKAIADYTVALKIEPHSAEVYYNRGVAYKNKGDIDLAIADYTEAIRLRPDYANAYNNRGNAYNSKEKYDLAIIDFTTALELKPDDAEAYNNRGNAYALKGEYDRAIEDYTRALQFNSDFAMAYNNRGNSYADTGDFDLAIADYSDAIRLKPDYANAYNNRGIVYGDTDDYDRAVIDYNKALELKPDYADAYYNRGIAYGNQGKYDRAIADFTETVRLEPDNTLAKRNLEQALRERGE